MASGNITVDASALTDADDTLRALVAKCSETIRAELKNTHVETKAVWSLGTGAGENKSIHLALSDYAGEVSTPASPPGGTPAGSVA